MFSNLQMQSIDGSSILFPVETCLMFRDYWFIQTFITRVGTISVVWKDFNITYYLNNLITNLKQFFLFQLVLD